MAGYAYPEVRALEADLLYTPLSLRRAHLHRLERLIPEIDPDRLYTYEYIFRRVTRFRPDGKGEKLLAGERLRHDLGLMLRRLTLSAPLDPQGRESALIPIASIASQQRVNMATVRRWGLSGLPLCHYLHNDGRSHLCVRRRALERFLATRGARSARPAVKTTGKERRALIARAEVLAKREGLAPTAVVRRLAGESGRSTTTVRRILRRHDRAVSAERAPQRGRSRLSEEQRRRLVALYRKGTPVGALARRFGRSRSAIYRSLHRALVESVLKLEIKYIPSSDFAAPNADKLCLGKDGLFTYPPEVTAEMPVAPTGLPPYLAELYAVPLLTRLQERTLFRKYNYIKYCMARLQEQIRRKGYEAGMIERFEALRQAADVVRRILIRCNLRLVVSIAKRHVGPLANLFELVSEGNVCLMRTVECYDYTRNARFATYATWAISKHFARVVPEQNYHLATFITGQEERIAATGDGRPDAWEHSEMVAHLRSIISRASAQLNDRERRIIESHFGTDGRPARTLAEIGKLFGLTRERIRQIEAGALRKLRKLIGPKAVEGLG